MGFVIIGLGKYFEIPGEIGHKMGQIHVLNV
jgi:hypothetical protein